MVYKSRSTDDNLHLGANGKRFSDAKFMRKNPTETEKILWQALRNRQLKGYKFRRQHPLFHFIADFYCHEVKLVIEIDGDYHQDITQKEKDEGRTYELTKYDIKVIRFKNEEVLNNLNDVLTQIAKFIKNIET